MKIAVTGGAGYIGSVCVELLCASGHEVLVIDNLSTGHRQAVDRQAGFEALDLRETERLAGVLRDFRPRAVMHFGGVASIAESMRDPGKYFDNNLGGGVSLLEAMEKAGVERLVYSSSCAVYGIPDCTPVEESAALHPINPYGESKLAFERALHWFEAVHGLSATVFRYFNAAGASRRCGEDSRGETHLISSIILAAGGKREAVEIYGTDYETPDGTAVRDYVHVRDLAAAHQRAVESGVSGVFNLGTGRGHSVREVVAASERVLGTRIPVRGCPRRTGDPPVLVASIEKAAREIGWAPRFPELDEMVRSAWEWRQEHAEGYEE
jgi:UDP-glucose 4-epimerase